MIPRPKFYRYRSSKRVSPIVLNLNLTGLCPLANILGGNMVSEIKNCCRASSVLAGQFWQTPPE